MTTFTISLPTAVARDVTLETKRQNFASRSEFIRSLLRRYFLGELQLEVFKPQPLAKIKLELAKSGKYSEKFIESVASGLKKSSAYAD